METRKKLENTEPEGEDLNPTPDTHWLREIRK